MSEIVYEVAPLFALKRTQADLVPECARYGFLQWSLRISSTEH